MERCPICRARLPEAKTCARAACGKTFYRSENGRSDASYCSARCASADRQARWRAKQSAES